MILVACNQEPPADYLIKDGTTIDGLGNQAMDVDLVIRNGMMEVVNSGASVNAVVTVDAAGLITI